MAVENDLEMDCRNQHRVKSRKNLFLVGITFMMSYSAYQGVLGLESSINVEEGLGTISVMVIHVTAAVSCVTFVPFLIDFYGAKTAIIVGEIGYATYIAAHFYPNWYTMILASVFHGLTESAPWTGTSVYIAFLGEQRWAKKKTKRAPKISKTKDSYVVDFFGSFYTLVYLGDLLGFGLIALILMMFKGSDTKVSPYSNKTISANGYMGTTDDHISSETITSTLATTEVLKRNVDLGKCGANDCQAEYIYNSTKEELENYNPDQTGTFVLLGLFVGIAAIAITLQAVCLTRAPAKFDKQVNNEDTLSFVNRENARMSNSKKLLMEIRDIFLHLISPLHLLVAPLVFYYGLFYGFCVTEYTRAFVSCAVGVERLGLALALFSGSGAATSIFCPKIMSCIGRKGFLLIVGIIHGSAYVVCLSWMPNQHNLWATYAIGVLLGTGEGSMVSLYQGLISHYFESKLGIAYSVQNLVTNLGVVALTGWGTTLCSYMKIYIQLGALVLALISVIAAEFKFKSIQRTRSRSVRTYSESE